MEMATKKALKSLGYQERDFKVAHCPLGEAKGQIRNHQVILVGLNFLSNFESTGTTKVIGIRNMMSEKEIAEKLKEAGFIPAA
jgi:PTS system ascorbate-specific IIB component